MKIPLLITILTVVIITFFISCSYKEPQNPEVVVIRDITDPHLSLPDVNEITSLFDLENNKWKGAVFRYVNITDVSYNHTFSASIKAESKWLSNEFERRKKVKGFYEQVIKILETSNKEKVGKDNSSVYTTIAQELNRISLSAAGKKIILIYSDLLENSKDLSLYNEKTLSLAQTNPGSLTKYFTSLVPLENLDGIKVFLIYRPSGVLQDKQYRFISGYYKNLLESKGAIVEISANIN